MDSVLQRNDEVFFEGISRIADTKKGSPKKATYFFSLITVTFQAD
jgi:hypothetical protein